MDVLRVIRCQNVFCRSTALCITMLLKMTAESMKREIEAITECPVCISSFTDPRILPCVHTNCYKCIKKWCKDKRNGDKTACPVCRRDFVIPTGGIEELPKNFYLTHLLSIIDLGLPDDSREIHHCDLCSSDENVSAVKSATMLCLDCQQKLCASCHSRHSKSKQFQTHKTVSIREKVAKHELCHKLPPYYCEKHRDESLKMYCFDSKTVSCMICYREQHHNHKCSEVSNLSDEFRTEAVHCIECLDRRIDENREKLTSLEDDKRRLSNKISADQRS